MAFDILDCLGNIFPGCGCYDPFYRWGSPLMGGGEVWPPGLDTQRPPVTHPTFCNGQDLWRLGMPRGVRPDDSRFEPGEISELIKGGPQVEVGGVLYSAAQRGVKVQHVLAAAGDPLSVATVGKTLIVRLAGDQRTTYEQLFKALAASDDAEELIAYTRPAGAPFTQPIPAPETALPQGFGTLTIVRGMPTDDFGFILECTRAGYLVRRAARDQTRLAAFRISLNNGRTWSLATPWSTDEQEPKSCGLIVRLADGGSNEVPFLKGERFMLHTRMSEQFRLAILASAADMVRSIRVADATPLKKWEADLIEINAVKAGYALMTTRGMDASASGRSEHNYDEEIRYRVKEMDDKLKAIAEGYQMLISQPAGEVPGIQAVSMPPQGFGNVML